MMALYENHEPALPPAKTEPFGEICIRQGFITRAQLEETLEIQRERKAAYGGHTLIGMLMVEIGILSTSQLIEILKYYEKRPSSADTP